MFRAREAFRNYSWRSTLTSDNFQKRLRRLAGAWWTLRGQGSKTKIAASKLEPFRYAFENTLPA